MQLIVGRSWLPLKGDNPKHAITRRVEDNYLNRDDDTKAKHLRKLSDRSLLLSCKNVHFGGECRGGVVQDDLNHISSGLLSIKQITIDLTVSRD